MKSILLLGATGYTGRLIAERLVALGAPVLIAGRDPAKLSTLRAELGLKQQRFVNLAGTTVAAQLDHAMNGCSVVVSAAGPFLALGEPVVQAALRNGLHYVDTSAEQAFIERIHQRYHQKAHELGVTLLPAQGADFSFAYCAAALLQQQLGPLASLSTYHELGDYRPSRGTAKSMIGMLREAGFAVRNGVRSLLSDGLGPEQALLPGYADPVVCAPFAGGEAALLPPVMPTLKNVSAYLVLSKTEARVMSMVSATHPLVRPLLPKYALTAMQNLVDRRLTDPEPSARKTTPWVITIRGERGEATAFCRITGPSTYENSADTAALAAYLLHQDRAQTSGVIPTGTAFPPADFLDSLATQGVRWHMQHTQAQRINMPGSEVRTEALVHASPAQLWQQLCNGQSWLEWNKLYAGLATAPILGQKNSFRINISGRQIAFPIRITELVPDHKLAWVGGLGKLGRGHHYFELHPTTDPTTCRLTHGERFEGPLMRALWTVLQPQMVEQCRIVTEQMAEYWSKTDQ